MMNLIIKIVLLMASSIPLLLSAQISGTVEIMEDGKSSPIPGANVFWLGTTVGATTNEEGNYTVPYSSESDTLVASFVGFKSERKVIISRKGTVNFTLNPTGISLKGAEIRAERDATALNPLSADLSFNIDKKELLKAACCNLSESFETNASVDVSFTDAVTGQRQIEMLGLAGKYALIQRENVPFGRGLNSLTGLTFIPGPFVESLQLTKGLSSVLNGYESITGQINVEFYKPETAPRLLLNAYGNQNGRSELNAITAFDVNEEVSSALFLHGSMVPFSSDGNADGFADVPVGDQINVLNRWHYQGNNGLEGQWGFSAIADRKQGGQISFVDDEETSENAWGYTSDTERYELFGKTGYVFENSPGRSVGFIYNYSQLDIESQFGNRDYTADQQSFYFNSIFEDIIGDTRHKYRTGLSLQFDRVNEKLQFQQAFFPLYLSGREEIVPGAFLEYSYEPHEALTVVTGVRADYNSLYDELFFTPRLHLRYKPADKTTLRIAGGRGQRSPNVLAENLNILASSRNLNFEGYDLYQPEVAWNTGASVNQKITLGEREIDFTVDAFYTYFESKMLTDLDENALQAYVLMNEGSRSFSLLAQAEYEVIERLNLRFAYKYLNSEEMFLSGLNTSYMVPKDRFFVNLAYSTKNEWKFDLTANWFGEKRLPSTESSPQQFQLPAYSDDFFNLNAQINKVFKNGFEFFAGVENMLNFKQSNPIVNPLSPFDDYFDSNFTWGPVFGRNIYAGMYYRIGKK